MADERVFDEKILDLSGDRTESPELEIQPAADWDEAEVQTTQENVEERDKKVDEEERSLEGEEYSPEPVAEPEPAQEVAAIPTNFHENPGPLHADTVRTEDGVVSEHEWARRDDKEAHFDGEKMVYRNERPDPRGHNER